MENKEKIRSLAENVWAYIAAFLRWGVLGLLVGGLGGFVGALFAKSVAWATAMRGANPWLLYLLPVGGLAIVGVYKLCRVSGVGTNEVFEGVRSNKGVSILLAPAIFLGTTITHLLGGSAGREGAALQIGGGLGWSLGRLFRLDDKDMRLATLCGMSALFSALFGTPLTATIFALEVISVGVVYYSGLVPCLTAALAAYGVTRLFDVPPTAFAAAAPGLSAGLLWRVAVLGIACAAMSIVFCVVMHRGEHYIAKALKNPCLRAAAGGFAIIGLTYLCGTTDYNGAGMELIERAIERGEAEPAAFALKLVFTAVTLGCGFRGGEVVPTFFIGATLGCVLGPLLGIPAGFAAAVGLVALFCGAVNCPVASIVLAVELFGSGGVVYFAVACAISYMLSGYTGLYSSQKIMYSKLRAEFIDIHAR